MEILVPGQGNSAPRRPSGLPEPSKLPSLPSPRQPDVQSSICLLVRRCGTVHFPTYEKLLKKSCPSTVSTSNLN